MNKIHNRLHYWLYYLVQLNMYISSMSMSTKYLQDQTIFLRKIIHLYKYYPSQWGKAFIHSVSLLSYLLDLQIGAMLDSLI